MAVRSLVSALLGLNKAKARAVMLIAVSMAGAKRLSAFAAFDEHRLLGLATAEAAGLCVFVFGLWLCPLLHPLFAVMVRGVPVVLAIGTLA